MAGGCKYLRDLPLRQVLFNEAASQKIKVLCDSHVSKSKEKNFQETSASIFHYKAFELFIFELVVIVLDSREENKTPPACYSCMDVPKSVECIKGKEKSFL